MKSSRHLEAARQRLQTRFRTKFPRVFHVQQRESPKPKITALMNNDHIEAARLRIRHRFKKRFPTAAVMPTFSSTHTLSDKGQKEHLEQARLRLRNRFLRKFLPDFTDFPESLENAEATMKDEQWGASNAVVITMPEPPFQILRVNKCWETLCGYTQREVFGKTFKSLGIQGPFTDPAALRMLHQQLEQNQRTVVHLTNATKDGSVFQNYLRVAPLRDNTTKHVTHFIAVLEDESSHQRQQLA